MLAFSINPFKDPFITFILLFTLGYYIALAISVLVHQKWTSNESNAHTLKFDPCIAGQMISKPIYNLKYDQGPLSIGKKYVSKK